ncbi:MAG: hydrogenase expression/formation protein HypE [Deltaproteobacteria bacterium]|nr:hydrogenase expression/formation protein HypE [Deltaproteobacteria bacterium]
MPTIKHNEQRLNMNGSITTAHGTGGPTSHQLIDELFKKHLAGKNLSPHDAAAFSAKGGNVIVTTDTHVVDPIIFPGGDIGRLSITGVVNDLLTRAGQAKYISLGFILEEGLELRTLEFVLTSMGKTMRECGIELLCADTKVIGGRGKTPGMMISSTLFGEPLASGISMTGPQPMDQVIVTGPVGSHGLAILQAREGLPFSTTIHSDCAPLVDLIAPILLESNSIHYMRDPTRGGVTGVLHELARQFSLSFELFESGNDGVAPTIPHVRAGLEILGLDPLEVANEGVMLIFASQDDAGQLVSRLQQHPLGRQARIIGSVKPKGEFPLTLKTALGGHRLAPWPEGLNLPRIC